MIDFNDAFIKQRCLIHNLIWETEEFCCRTFLEEEADEQNILGHILEEISMHLLVI